MRADHQYPRVDSFRDWWRGAARVLFKGGVHLERAATVKVVALDKTGTLTEGKPRVTDVIVDGRVVNFRNDSDASALELLRLAAAVEAKSEHPLAQAIVTEAKGYGLTPGECAGFQSSSGKGASGLVNGRRIAVGNARYFAAQSISIPDSFERQVAALQGEGKTSVVVGDIDEKSGTRASSEPLPSRTFCAPMRRPLSSS